MIIYLDDLAVNSLLYPFTQTRSIVDIRLGIHTIREKWELYFGQAVYTTDPKFQSVTVPEPSEDSLIIPANRIPLRGLDANTIDLETILANSFPLENLWQLFGQNDFAIRYDFDKIVKDRQSNSLSVSNKVVSTENVFVEEGANVEHVIIDASTGPVYIGKNAQIMAGCMIRGPLALCEGAVLKMGSKVYGATTIGPYCIAAGEIKNSIMFGYSNKAHDGYLGDSVIGEWCNLGAGTTNSNMKNTAGEVKLYNNQTGNFDSAGKKCGLMMGDYSRTAVNTSFNTGTVVGVCCNIFGEIFPPKFIPDFSWGRESYLLDKAIQDVDNWKKLKGSLITEKEKQVLSDIYRSIQKHNNA